uniref:Ig-like domain-containing protein n=1 Tax=Sinocyclocheilus anshuiensis TaxID=1608454 RepID=A0A671KDB4_9TELE
MVRHQTDLCIQSRVCLVVVCIKPVDYCDVFIIFFSQYFMSSYLCMFHVCFPFCSKTRSHYLFSQGIRKGNEKALLVCSAYDFHPKPINLTWMRDDTKMKANIHFHLEYFPKPGEKISCVIMSFILDPSLEDFDRNKLITGAAGLVLGAVIADVGLIYCKKSLFVPYHSSVWSL